MRLRNEVTCSKSVRLYVVEPLTQAHEGLVPDNVFIKYSTIPGNTFTYCIIYKHQILFTLSVSHAIFGIYLCMLFQSWLDALHLTWHPSAYVSTCCVTLWSESWHLKSHGSILVQMIQAHPGRRGALFTVAAQTWGSSHHHGYCWLLGQRKELWGIWRCQWKAPALTGHISSD